jgi:DNA-binding MarR family transcriptional regulator
MCMSRKERTTAEAIGQQRPFRNRRQEAIVALWVTADRVRRRFTDIFAAHGEITMQQYNVLRILRGAGPGGLPTLTIVERMMERTPGITALLDRLEAKGLVERDHGVEDRRQILRRITRKGLGLLASLDRPLDQMDDKVVGCLDDDDTARLIELLDRVRNHQPED